MSDCCKSNNTDKTESPSCCGGNDRMIMLYACSGLANVGEISDKAAQVVAFVRNVLAE